ncbi:MAG: rRNA maturation RNase YbeY [Firmicutes bacterium]|nr:rRNA maturation RNase YbeY [Bacillota bacterium]
MAIGINNLQDKLEVEDDLVGFLESLLARGLSLEGKDPREVEVSVALVDDDHIRSLNKQYRGIDAPTDVLSFSMLEGEDDDMMPGPGPGGGGDRESGPAGPGGGSGPCVEGPPELLGDIVISLESAARQGDEYGHGFVAEVGRLAVHGLLHLLGYDHELDTDRDLMEGRGEAILEGGLQGLCICVARWRWGPER